MTPTERQVEDALISERVTEVRIKLDTIKESVDSLKGEIIQMRLMDREAVVKSAKVEQQLGDVEKRVSSIEDQRLRVQLIFFGAIVSMLMSIVTMFFSIGK